MSASFISKKTLYSWFHQLWQISSSPLGLQSQLQRKSDQCLPECIHKQKYLNSLTFNKPVFNLQVKVAEIDGIVTASEDGMKWNVVLPGIKPGPYAPHIVANNMIVLTEDITIKPALGGDGDLP